MSHTHPVHAAYSPLSPFCFKFIDVDVGFHASAEGGGLGNGEWGMGGKGVQTRLQRDKTHYRCDRKDNTRFSVQTRLLMDAQTQVSSLGVGVILVAFMGAGKGGRVSSGGTSKWKIIVVFLKPSLLLRRFLNVRLRH